RALGSVANNFSATICSSKLRLTSTTSCIVRNFLQQNPRHDGAGEPGAQLSSWSFVENLKRYAREAGIRKIHLHQTRPTFARMVAQRAGSLNRTRGGARASARRPHPGPCR